MFDMNFIFYCIFVTAIAIGGLFVFNHLNQKRGKGKAHWMTALGVVLLGVCVYFFPFGAIDAYEATRVIWSLDYVQNSLLWYGITITFAVFGVILLKIGSCKGGKKK